MSVAVSCWALHTELHEALKLEPWEFPAIRNPKHPCDHPPGTGGAEWYLHAVELWRQLDDKAKHADQTFDTDLGCGMGIQIALASMMVIVTTVIQSGFTVAAIRGLRRHVSEEHSLWHSTLVLALFVLWLFLATILQVWAWALLYLALDAIGSLEQAAYFSMETFSTLGFGDITLSKDWRLLSSFEAANGLLMFGWSTALVFAAVQSIYRMRKHSAS